MNGSTIALLSALAVAWAALLPAPAACAQPGRDAPLRAVVDLDRPGALEVLARENPQHYAKIQRILADVSRQRPDAVPRWMSAEFGAKDVSFPWLLRTSDPARRSLAFTLDRVRYEAMLQVPTRWSFGGR